MNARVKNTLLIVSVGALAFFPLLTVKQPAAKPDRSSQAERFKGTDDQAAAAVQELSPGYRPWFRTIYEAPSPQIDTLIFALQAVVGAGFIGYYVGYSRRRSKTIAQKPAADRAY